jgi:hypothetical protein
MSAWGDALLELVLDLEPDREIVERFGRLIEEHGSNSAQKDGLARWSRELAGRPGASAGTRAAARALHAGARWYEDRAAALAALGEADALAADAPRIRAWILVEWARLFGRHEPDEARAKAREALAWCRQIGDRRREVDCWSSIWSLAMIDADWPAARAGLDEAITLSDALGLRDLEAAHRRFRRAQVHRALGELEAAWQDAASAIAVSDHFTVQVDALCEQARVRLAQGRPNDARALLDRAAAADAELRVFERAIAEVRAELEEHR